MEKQQQKERFALFLFRIHKKLHINIYKRRKGDYYGKETNC